MDLSKSFEEMTPQEILQMIGILNVGARVTFGQGNIMVAIDAMTRSAKLIDMYMDHCEKLALCPYCTKPRAEHTDCEDMDAVDASVEALFKNSS